jgi:hypothetical protein
MRIDLAALADELPAGAILRQHPADATGLREQLQQRVVQVLQSAEFLAPAMVRR